MNNTKLAELMCFAVHIVSQTENTSSYTSSVKWKRNLLPNLVTSNVYSQGVFNSESLFTRNENYPDILV